MKITLAQNKYDQTGENLSERVVVLLTKKDLYRLMEIKSQEERRLGVDRIDQSEFMRGLVKEQIHRYYNTGEELFEL